jgi:uncharacterized protein (DUF1697 family)
MTAISKSSRFHPLSDPRTLHDLIATAPSQFSAFAINLQRHNNARRIRFAMPTYIALLRGINVGGHNKIAMADLKRLFDTLGFTNARTLLQSGNVVFQSTGRNAPALEALLEAETKAQLDLSVEYIVRTSTEWKKIIEANPFPKEAKSDPSHLLVMFAKSALRPIDVKALQAAITGPEEIIAVGKQLYVAFNGGIAQSKLTNSLIEKKLGTRGTARNWNTVVKVADAADGCN